MPMKVDYQLRVQRLLRNTSVLGYDGLAVRRFSRRSTDYKSVVPVFLTHCTRPVTNSYLRRHHFDMTRV